MRIQALLSLVALFGSSALSSSQQLGLGGPPKTVKLERSGKRQNFLRSRKRSKYESGRYRHRVSRPLSEATNEELDPKDCTNSWTTIFGDGTFIEDDVHIPHGMCVQIDITSSEINVAGGIDVGGMLVIPDGSKDLILRTKFIRVTGEFHITASGKVGSTPKIRIILEGTDDEITPFDKKSISVQEGGKVVWNGWPETAAPTWVKLYDVQGNANEYTQELVLENSTVEKWGIGAELLITSHTLDWDDQQVATIKSISESYHHPGYAVYELEEPIRRPTTAMDNEYFAVEVALLSRNIGFEGARDDENEHHGAHLIVYFTDRPDQLIEGCDFQNFGQQGVLGRYPIHFHLCGDVEGSIVRKNTIRHSNQRCVVVHGTHKLLIQENIAFDTKGHCFMTEDGFEEENVFLQNLGALTKVPENIIPDMGSNGKETDDHPATFWITNPNNDFIGNVAAGSQANGFWWELNQNVRGDFASEYQHINPQTHLLGRVEDNTAHSNSRRAFSVYPPGYTPSAAASFFRVKSYRNRNVGIFVHNSKNIALEGGIAADNRGVGVDIDRAETIQVRNMNVVGVSPEFERMQALQGERVVCPTHASRIVGMELSTFVRGPGDKGVVIENVTFSGFVGAGCDSAPIMSFDGDEVRSGTYDYQSTISSIVMEPGAASIDLCHAAGAGVDDIFLVDSDSSLMPSTLTSGATNSGPSTSVLLSNNPQMTSFVNANQCEVNEDLCHVYCVDACFRTIVFHVDLTWSEDWIVRVCDVMESSRCIDVGPKAIFHPVGQSEEQFRFMSTRVNHHREFHIKVPSGSYEATFYHEDVPAWPMYVFQTLDEPLCEDSITEESIKVVRPPVKLDECQELIRNGDGETSGVMPLYWLHRGLHGDVRLLPDQGMNQTNALADVSNKRAADSIAQHIDTRCLDLMRGRQYVMEAWVKLTSSPDGSTVVYQDQCDPSAGIFTCPVFGISAHNVLHPYYGGPGATVSVPGRFTGEFSSEGFHQIRGVFTVSDAFADATNVHVFVRKNRENSAMIVDNVSMSLVEGN